MMRVFLIRHGETEWNRELVFRGRADIPLSDRGRQQAALVGAALAKEDIRTIYSSPLSRALETAAAIASGRNLEIETADELIDMNFGAWEGLSVNEVKSKFPDEFALWAQHPERAIPPGGEGLADIRTRLRAGLAKWILENPHTEAATIALVSHRVVCKVAVCEVLGLDNAAFWRIQQDLCALNLFIIDNGKYSLYKMNETCHLQLLPRGTWADF